MIPAVNFHLYEPCNMRCKFCFATFQDVKQSVLPKGHLPKEQALQVVRELAGLGFEKITFAGGEPTLCPWLPELIAQAKTEGMTTMIVSNGSRLSGAFFQENARYLDWITLSIDSLNPETNLAMGRAVLGRKPISEEGYLELIRQAKKWGYRLKINTVVCSKNHTEDLSDFISQAGPERWKIFQVLPVIGQNDREIADFVISEEQFAHFLSRHSAFEGIMVPEWNDDMQGSYAMVDPAGRFYDTSSGTHQYSSPILEAGAEAAFQEMPYDFSKFMKRRGFYDWKNRA